MIVTKFRDKIYPRRENPTLQIEYSDEIYNQCLILLDDLCQSMSGRSLSQFGLPSPQRNETGLQFGELLREQNYDSNTLMTFVSLNEPQLVPDQRAAYIHILESVRSEKGGIIFLDAPGGTGKTFVINLLLATIRRDKGIALAVASSGIASTLLAGGRTAHSAFKLPLNMNHSENVTCNISKGSGKAKVLQQCSLIVWDECTMSHKRALEALDNVLQDLRGNRKLMGGTVVVLAGDFRQTLPVIPRSTPSDELNACLKASRLWNQGLILKRNFPNV